MTPSKKSVRASPSAAAARAPRIHAVPVAPLVPSSGDVPVLIVGEAPGPRGADKSGIPFFGDAAGRHLYRALRSIGAVELPDSIDAVKWDGAVLAAAGYTPIAHGMALTNAYDRCPTDDGLHFRAPARTELEDLKNVQRLSDVMRKLQARRLRTVVTLGRVATRTMQHVIDANHVGAIALVPLPHPSAQGLLSMAENRGRGARMADLEAEWMRRCVAAIETAWNEART